MAIIKLYSRRLQEASKTEPDIYQYDVIPSALRVQVSMAIQDAMGTEREYMRNEYVREAYELAHNILKREYGTESLPSTHSLIAGSDYACVHRQITHDYNILNALDAIELCCSLIDGEICRGHLNSGTNANDICDSSISEINQRFRQHAIGYEYANGQIIRIDSQVIHEEAIKPALLLLSDPEFAGAEEEFHKAFQYYRHGENKAAIASCVASLESTMKSVISIMGWELPQKQTVKPLFDVMYEKELIPPFWHGHFGGLRSMLESGVPTVRNKLAGHGQGPEIVEVPANYVSFALHQTAACIVFLVKAMDDMRS